MAQTRSIDCIDDNTLVDYIDRAARRVFCMCPGISKQLGGALVAAGKRLGSGAVSIIVDMDAEVYRLGYGTLDGLKLVQEGAYSGAVEVRSQAGVRIGLLIADDAALVFAPTPQLIEAEPAGRDRPNGIILGSVPPAVARDAGLGGQPPIVGLDGVAPAQMHLVQQELERNPPARFDLARQVRVYSNHFQFVELELENVYISRQRVTMPPHLSGLGGEPELEARIHTQFTLLHDTAFMVRCEERVITERSLRERRDSLVRDYLIQLTGYGKVLHRQRKQEFDRNVEALRADVREFQAGVQAQLAEQSQKIKAMLIKALLPRVRQNPPKQYQKYGSFGQEDDGLQLQLERDIDQMLRRTASVAEKMDVRVVYKDIAYESLQDDKFLAALKKARLDAQGLRREADAVEANRSHTESSHIP